MTGRIMKVRKLRISNFRGIKKLEWIIPNERLVCLIGSGDTGKSTVLEALNLLLSDKWNIPIGPLDFNSTDDAIVIEAVIVDIPEGLRSIAKLGLMEAGLSDNCEVVEAPTEGAVPCLCINLTIDDSLEPKWSVLNPVSGTSQLLGASSRREFGVYKLDERADVHLRWTRVSALGRFANKRADVGPLSRMAGDAARRALAEMQLPGSVKAVLDEVKARAEGFGAPTLGSLTLGIDETGASAKDSMSLYAEGVPMSSFGRGTKKLSSLAIQNLGSASKTTYLVDEIETGLEPHRIVGLLQLLEKDETIDQAFVVSHSNVVVEYCECRNLTVVLSDRGLARIERIPEELSGLHRSNPSAFLAKRVLVVEGKTEEGLFKAFIREWDRKRRGDGLEVSGSFGSIICQGNGGANACKKASGFANLGIVAALFIDSDDSATNEKASRLTANGLPIFQWESNLSTEAALVNCLDRELCRQMVDYVVDEGIQFEDRVLKHLHHSGLSADVLSVEDIPWYEFPEEEARRMVLSACTFKKQCASGGKTEDQGWFKGVREGELLAEWILKTENFQKLQHTTFWSVVSAAKTQFLYASEII